MELVLKNPNNGPIEQAKDLLVVMACEDARTAPHACALLKRVGLNVGDEGRFIYSWWTFSVLSSAALRQVAANEAAAADIIVVAAHEGPGLPQPVGEWLRLWVGKASNPRRAKALVALLEPYQTYRGVTNELKRMAELGSLDFFANGEGVYEDSALTGEPVRPSGNSLRCAVGCRH